MEETCVGDGYYMTVVETLVGAYGCSFYLEGEMARDVRLYRFMGHGQWLDRKRLRKNVIRKLVTISLGRSK